MILALVLSPSLDISFRVDELRLGEIHRPSASISCAGGKGLNMARAAHRLGGDVRAIAALGGPTGEQIVDQLAAADVACTRVPLRAETRTCVSIGSDSDGALTEVYSYPTPLTRDETDDLLRVYASVLEQHRPDWVAFSGGLPPGVEPADLSAIARLTSEAGAKLAIDTYGPAFLGLVAAGVALVKINRAEAQAFLEESVADLGELASEVARRCGCLSVITDGERGSAAVEPGSSAATLVGASSRRGGFPVGSGDSYFGGLLTALDRGESVQQSLLWAAAAGTANAMIPGAAMIEVETVRGIRAELTPHQ